MHSDMLLNLSNHPSNLWPSDQIKAATDKYGKIQDLPFPDIDPSWDTDKVVQVAEQYESRILAMVPFPLAVHVMGEFTFTLALVGLLQAKGIHCIASTTERIVTDKSNGKRVTTFRFVRFREYPVITV